CQLGALGFDHLAQLLVVFGQLILLLDCLAVAVQGIPGGVVQLVNTLLGTLRLGHQRLPFRQRALRCALPQRHGWQQSCHQEYPNRSHPVPPGGHGESYRIRHKREALSSPHSHNSTAASCRDALSPNTCSRSINVFLHTPTVEPSRHQGDIQCRALYPELPSACCSLPLCWPLPLPRPTRLATLLCGPVR